MKLSVSILLFCLLLSRVLAGERIHSFDSYITLRVDGSAQVRETIILSSNAETVKNGMTRELPNMSRGDWGRRVILPVKVSKVLVDGRTMPIYTLQTDNSLSVVLGDAMIDMPPGKHSFELQYEMKHAVSSSQGHDEFAWNATGDRVILPIDQAHVVVKLPDTVAARQVTVSAYSGLSSSTERSPRIEKKSGDALVITSAYPLRPGEMLTVKLRWPQGLVRARQPDAAMGLGMAGLLLLVVVTFCLACYLYISYSRLRVPSGHTTATAPPAGLSPAAARYLALGRCDPWALACAMIDMAARGIMRIELHRRGFTLHLLSEAVTSEPAEHKLIIDNLLAGRSSFTVKRSYQQDTQRLMGEFAGYIRHVWRPAVLSRHGLALLVLVLGVACSASVILMFGPFNPVWVVVYTACWSAWVILISQRGRWVLRRSFRSARGGTVRIIAALLMLAPAVIVWHLIPGELGLVTVCSMLLIASVLSSMYARVPSPEGRHWFGKLAQFQRHLNAQDRVHPECLAYAMALEIGVHSVEPTSPDWLTLPGQGRVSSYALCDRLAMDIAQSAVQPIRPSRHRLDELCSRQLHGHHDAEARPTERV